MPKISVLIPVYNTEKYLNDLLNSVVNQTFNDIEIIIINDGSTDSSEKIIKQFCTKYSNIKYFYKENTGVADTRNILLSKATGEFINFVDSDDTIEKTMYQDLYEIAKSKNSDIVICDYDEIYSNFTKTIKGLDMDSVIVSPPSLCNKIIKRQLFDNLTFSNVSIGEDTEVILTIMTKTDKIEYLPRTLYNYHIRQNSLMTKKKYSAYWNDIFTVFTKLDDILEEYPLELEYLYIQHILRDSSIRFMYYKEGKNSLNKINNIMKKRYNNFNKNKYYKKKDLRYRIICNLLYHRMYFIVKLIRRAIGLGK